MKILVVEDERKVAKALRDGLAAQHYDVTVAHTGEEGYFLVSEQVFDLVLLDLMLPGRDGFQVLQTLRRSNLHTPVLVLTARDSLEDRVTGLDLGADDYLVKPFAFPELLARIRALLRRGRVDQASRLQFADLEMDLLARRTFRSGQAIELTSREFEVLEYLLKHQGRVVSREMLARDVWRETVRATPLDNVIDVHMTRLRKKVDDPFDSKLVRTVRGVGYTIGDPAV
jgi:two-component system, OmpR family, copper resistance phosphate regulon response regulator CusR